MVSVMEFLQVGKEGLANKDSSGVEKFITDDFQMTTPMRILTRQEFLDWVASGGSPTVPSDFEVIYENDDIAVVYHSVQSGNALVLKPCVVGAREMVSSLLGESPVRGDKAC